MMVEDSSDQPSKHFPRKRHETPKSPNDNSRQHSSGKEFMRTPSKGTTPKRSKPHLLVESPDGNSAAEPESASEVINISSDSDESDSATTPDSIECLDDGKPTAARSSLHQGTASSSLARPLSTLSLTPRAKAKRWFTTGGTYSSSAVKSESHDSSDLQKNDLFLSSGATGAPKTPTSARIPAPKTPVGKSPRTLDGWLIRSGAGQSASPGGDGGKRKSDSLESRSQENRKRRIIEDGRQQNSGSREDDKENEGATPQNQMDDSGSQEEEEASYQIKRWREEHRLTMTPKLRDLLEDLETVVAAEKQKNQQKKVCGAIWDRVSLIKTESSTLPRDARESLLEAIANSLGIHTVATMKNRLKNHRKSMRQSLAAAATQAIMQPRLQFVPLHAATPAAAAAIQNSPSNSSSSSVNVGTLNESQAAMKSGVNGKERDAVHASACSVMQKWCIAYDSEMAPSLRELISTFEASLPSSKDMLKDKRVKSILTDKIHEINTESRSTNLQSEARIALLRAMAKSLEMSKDELKKWLLHHKKEKREARTTDVTAPVQNTHLHLSSSVTTSSAKMKPKTSENSKSGEKREQNVDRLHSTGSHIEPKTDDQEAKEAGKALDEWQQKHQSGISAELCDLLLAFKSAVAEAKEKGALKKGGKSGLSDVDLALTIRVIQMREKCSPGGVNSLLNSLAPMLGIQGVALRRRIKGIKEREAAARPNMITSPPAVCPLVKTLAAATLKSDESEKTNSSASSREKSAEREQDHENPVAADPLDTDANDYTAAESESTLANEGSMTNDDSDDRPLVCRLHNRHDSDSRAGSVHTMRPPSGSRTRRRKRAVKRVTRGPMIPGQGDLEWTAKNKLQSLEFNELLLEEDEREAPLWEGDGSAVQGKGKKKTEEWPVDHILATDKKAGLALIKWTGWVHPTWDYLSYVKDGPVMKHFEHVRAVVASQLRNRLISERGGSSKNFAERYPGYEILFNRKLNRGDAVSDPWVLHCVAVAHFAAKLNRELKGRGLARIYVVDWTGKPDPDTIPKIEFTNNIEPTDAAAKMLEKAESFVPAVRCDCGEKEDGCMIASSCKCHRLDECEDYYVLEPNGLLKCPETDKPDSFDEREIQMHECGDSCSCTELCDHKLVQRGRTEWLILFRDWQKGWTLRAANYIDKGRFVSAYSGELLTLAESQEKGDLTYQIRLPLKNDNGELVDAIIDAKYKGNEARWYSHSCEPNLYTMRVRVNRKGLAPRQIAIFTNRPIYAFEELSMDYFSHLSKIGFPCCCNSPKCRRPKHLEPEKPDGESSEDEDEAAGIRRG